MMWRRLLAALAPFLGVALLLLLFCSVQTPEGKPVRDYFLTADNFRFIAAQSVIVAVGALGMTMIVISGGIDLSAGSAIALASVAAATVLHQEGAAMLAILAAVLTGGLVGLANGLLISSLRAAPFIITLGMLNIARGAAQWLAREQPAVAIPGETFIGLMAPLPADSLLIVAPAVWITLLLAALMLVVMRCTVFGRHIYAIGSNEAATELCGIRTRVTKVLIYAGAGLFFGLAGLFEMARLRQGNPTAAFGLELDIIAAVVIGGASLRGGTGSILGSLLGAVMITMLRNGSQQAGWPVYTQEIIIGGVILGAVALDRLRREP